MLAREYCGSFQFWCHRRPRSLPTTDAIYATIPASLEVVSCACAFIASRLKRDRAIGDFQVKHRPDGPIHQDDLAPMGAYELRRDREAEPGAAGPRRSLERLEEMRPRLIRESGTGIRNLDDHDRPLAPPGH